MTAARHQVIVVTGASSGFGRLTAVALARAGHAVAADENAGEPSAAERDEPYGELRAGLADRLDRLSPTASL
ncbi:hypothetical protein [Nonomuraea sp. NPDC050783]|uniref:hypothetical protein n=1 Tax=Nonomuraea sp. NPDC050783 TaxID=3154634 RepID=UPI0034667907